jgi:hypothetical protein
MVSQVGRARIQGERPGEGRQQTHCVGKGRRRPPALLPCGAAQPAEGPPDRPVTEETSAAEVLHWLLALVLVAMAHSDGGGVAGSALELQAEYGVHARGWVRGAPAAEGG